MSSPENAPKPVPQPQLNPTLAEETGKAYAKYAGHVKAVAARTGIHANGIVSAEDVTQEVFIKLFLHTLTEQNTPIESIQTETDPIETNPKENAKNWLSTVARTTAIDHWRRHRRDLQNIPLETNSTGGDEEISPAQNLPDTTQPTPVEYILEQEQKAILQRAFSNLTPDVRKVIKLRFMQELTQEETAQILNIPRGTVAARQRAGINRLRQLISHYFSEES